MHANCAVNVHLPALACSSHLIARICSLEDLSLKQKEKPTEQPLTFQCNNTSACQCYCFANELLAFPTLFPSQTFSTQICQMWLLLCVANRYFTKAWWAVGRNKVPCSLLSADCPIVSCLQKHLLRTTVNRCSGTFNFPFFGNDFSACVTMRFTYMTARFLIPNS